MTLNGKLRLDLSEEDIKSLIKKAVESETRMKVSSVTLTCHAGYSDPREHQAARVTASVTFSSQVDSPSPHQPW